MPVPYIVGNLYNMYRQGQQHREGVDAFNRLSEQLMREYNNPGTGPRPVDPDSFIERGKAIGEAQGGQAAFQYLLGQTDPTALAQLTETQDAARQQALATQQLQQQHQAHLRSLPEIAKGGVAGVDPASAGGFAMMQPQQAGAQIAQAGAASDPTQPAAIQVSKYYEGLTPDERQRFRESRGGLQTVATGGGGRALVGPGGMLQQLVSADQYAQDAAASDISQKDAVRRYTAQVEMPGFEANTESTVKLLDEIADDPALGKVYGVAGVLPDAPGSDAAILRAKIQRYTGQAFLNAVNNLTASIGPISNAEGERLIQSATILQNPKISAAAAREEIARIKTGLKRLQTMKQDQATRVYSAGGAQQSPQLQPEPQTDDGKVGRFQVRLQ